MIHHSDAQSRNTERAARGLPGAVCDNANVARVSRHLRSVSTGEKIFQTVKPVATPLRQEYRSAMKLIGQAHQQMLCVLKDELDRRGIRAINNVQALILFHFEDEVLRVSDLRAQGRYAGSNVTYNVQKLVEAGYVQREPSETDRRVVFVKLTPKGRELAALLGEMFDHHTDRFESIAEVSGDDIAALNTGLKKLDRFWQDQIRFRL